MVFDLEPLIPKERRELPPETRKRYAEHYATVLEKYGYFRDKENAAAFDKIADYFGQWWAAEKEQADYPERGLFIFGAKGAGKSQAMKIFSGLFGIDFIPVWDFAHDYAVGKAEGFWYTADRYRNSHLIVDDLGNEDDIKSFGNQLPMSDFLRKRADYFFDNPRKHFTFFTSDATSRDEIINRYGDTVFSRIVGMCDFIEFKGHDRRFDRNNKR